MDQDQLDPVAALLHEANGETIVYRRQFMDGYGHPPTKLAKVHHFRAVAQALVNNGKRFQLNAEYAEFGRLSFIDRTTNAALLIRSARQYEIERAQQQGTLFDLVLPSETLVVYGFHKAGLDLSVAGTRRQLGKKRVLASGPATFMGTWPYLTDTPPSFDQGQRDTFEELDEDYEDDEGDQSGEAG